MTIMHDGAVAAYQGYEYQIYATVWLTLDLVLSRRWCDAIVVEPTSQEDAAAELDVPAENAVAELGCRAAQTTPLSIDVQIKHRSQMLTAREFVTIVDGRPTRQARATRRRERPVSYLANDDTKRFVLITDGQVQRTLAPFRISHVGATSEGLSLPRSRATANVCRRLGIIDQRVLALVLHDIRSLLEAAGRVPFQRLDDCIASLVVLVRNRLLGRARRELDREELLEVVRRHGGLSTSAMAEFVPPIGFAETRGRIESSPFALILVGAPGSGKTFVAEKIVEMHRNQDRPFEILKDPPVAQVRSHLNQPGRTLFYLEDPWGRYRALEAGRTWIDELPRLIRSAKGHPDKRFLVTSRTSVLADSLLVAMSADASEHAQRQLGAYVARLQEGDFDTTRRKEILRRWMEGAERWQLDWVEKVEDEVVSQLGLPHALSMFAHRVRSLPTGTTLELSTLLKESEVASIASVVATHIVEASVVASATVLWAFLGSGEAFTAKESMDVSVWMQEAGERDIDVARVIVTMERNGWIRNSDRGLNAHPSVIEGLEHVVNQEALTSRRVIQALFSALAAHEATERAARIAHAFRDRTLPVPSAARDAMENHLREAALGSSDGDLVAAAEMLEAVSTARDPVSMLIRALVPAAKDKSEILPAWREPDWTADDHQAVEASPEAKAYLKRWIAIGLSRKDYTLNEEGLAAFICSFRWDLDDDLHAAVIAALADDSFFDVALHAALSGRAPRFDQLLDAAFSCWDRAEEWLDNSGNPAVQLQARDGQLDADYSAHVLDEPGERFHAPRQALELIVKTRREREGYSWIVEHPRGEQLIGEWAKALPMEPNENLAPELRAMLQKAASWNRGHALKAIGWVRCEALVPVLFTELTTASFDNLDSAWSALFAIYSSECISEVVRNGLAQITAARRLLVVSVALHAGIANPKWHIDPSEHRAAVRATLTRNESTALQLCIDVRRQEVASNLDPEVSSILEECTLLQEDAFAAVAALVLASHGVDIGMPIDRWAGSTDPEARFYAIRMALLVDPPRTDILRVALVDSDYRCRRRALYGLAELQHSDDRTRILEAATDRSAPVREACVRVIGHRKWEDGVPVLLSLLRDSRNRFDGRLDQEYNPDCHVARAAAKALLRFDLPKASFKYVVSFVAEGAQASRDILVHGELLRTLAKYSDPALPPLFERLFVSKRRVGGPNGTYPLRYAAMWSWFEHLLRHPMNADALPVSHFASAASHTDENLAAPALLVMGVLARSYPMEAEACAHRIMAEPMRQALIHAGAWTASPIRLPMSVPGPEAGLRLLSWAWDIDASDTEWVARYEADEEARRWFAEIVRPGKLHAALRATVRASPRGSLLGEIAIDDLRANEIPEASQLLTAFSMMGME